MPLFQIGMQAVDARIMLQGNVGRGIKTATVQREARAVAWTVPGLIGGVVVQRAAHVRTGQIDQKFQPLLRNDDAVTASMQTYDGSGAARLVFRGDGKAILEERFRQGRGVAQRIQTE